MLDALLFTGVVDGIGGVGELDTETVAVVGGVEGVVDKGGVKDIIGVVEAGIGTEGVAVDCEHEMMAFTQAKQSSFVCVAIM